MSEFSQLRSGVVVPANFAEGGGGRPDLGEIATTGNGRDITRGYVDGSPLLQQQDTVLIGRAGGDYRVYEDIARDDQVKTVFEQRRSAVTSREWEVTPGDDDARAEEAAEFLTEQLYAISWDRVTEKMLWGIFYGFAVGEVLWGVDGNRVVMRGIKVRKARRFGFAPDMSLRLKTLASPFGEALPPRKFWSYSVGADNDDEPHGLGLAHWLYWPVFFKRNGIKFWLMFLEKFGQPTALGTYPAGAQAPERARLLQALRAISTDTGIAVPQGMGIELLEAARSGTADYTELYDRMNAAISKVTIGHSGAADSTPGRLGGEEQTSDVREDLVKADADLICESFNLGPVRWLTEWNFGPDVAPPQVWRKVEEPEDLNALAERDVQLRTIGFRPTLERVTRVYGPDYEPAPPIASPFGGPGSAQFAEADGRDPAAKLADQVEDRVAKSFLEFMEPIKRLVAGAKSLEEIRDGLAAMYPDMDESGIAKVLQEASAAAHLAGRYEATR